MKKYMVKSPKVPFWKKQIPAYWLMIIFMIATSITYLALEAHSPAPDALAEKDNVSSESCLSEIKYVRMSGYSFARPMLFANVEVEDQSLAGLKSAVSDYIDSARKAGRLQSASVFFKKLDSP